VLAFPSSQIQPLFLKVLQGEKKGYIFFPEILGVSTSTGCRGDKITLNTMLTILSICPKYAHWQWCLKEKGIFG